MRNKDTRYWFNLGVFALIAFTVTLFAGVAFTSYKSTAIYMHPHRRPGTENETPDAYGIAYENIRLVTRDGVELAAWYTPPENGALILVAHGHGGRRNLQQYVLYAGNGYGVLAWDFRAHGESGGELSTLGYAEALDVEAALDFGLQQAAVEHIGAWGCSMGGAAVLEAASRRGEIEAVVVDSTFPTLENELGWMVNSRIFLPFIWFFAEMETGLKIEMLKPVDRIAEISPRPVMIIQGEADSVIPADSAQQLYTSAGEPKYLWTEAGVGHVGMYAAYPDKYERMVIGLFDEHLLRMSE